jgi:hypothetical protein
MQLLFGIDERSIGNSPTGEQNERVPEYDFLKPQMSPKTLMKFRGLYMHKGLT